MSIFSDLYKGAQGMNTSDWAKAGLAATAATSAFNSYQGNGEFGDFSGGNSTVTNEAAPQEASYPTIDYNTGQSVDLTAADASQGAGDIRTSSYNLPEQSAFSQYNGTPNSSVSGAIQGPLTQGQYATSTGIGGGAAPTYALPQTTTTIPGTTPVATNAVNQWVQPLSTVGAAYIQADATEKAAKIAAQTEANALAYQEEQDDEEDAATDAANTAMYSGFAASGL